jgi:hypothetical protein
MVLSAVATPEATGYFANGASLGSIPDSPGGPPGSWGPARNVTFTVSGLTQNVTGIRLMFTATHSYVGDLEVVLISPAGVRQHTIFSRTGATNDTHPGSPGNLNGIYWFDDSAVFGWWNNVASLTANQNAPEFLYRTSAAGPSGTPPPTTQLSLAFAGLTPALANGTWTLRFRDGLAQDTGAVTAATLHVLTGAVPGGHGSFDSDSLTDLGVARPTGNAWNWYIDRSSDGFLGVQWGLLGNDFFVPADYDGDGRTDIGVYRAGTFYIRLSSTQSLLAQPWGLSTDFPAVGDFDGDGRTDFAVYRYPPTPEGQGYFYVLRSLDGGLMVQPWGAGTDGFSGGDYDGDGKQDFVVRRPIFGPEPAVLHVLQSTAGYKAVQWGFGNDIEAPRDFDGDGKTDVGVVRLGAQYTFYILRSRDGGLFALPWGTTFDALPSGDYTGDGKADVVVWRPGPAPGGSVYYIRSSTTGALIVRFWGLDGDSIIVR